MTHDHEHDHDHDHDHDHGHPGHHHGVAVAAPAPGSAFAVGVGLNLAFVVVEAVYGVLAHSMALLADAAHNLGDVLGLLLAWGAAVLARRPPSPRRTYGLRRSTILAALANAVLLLVAVGVVCREAVLRLGAPTPVPGITVVVVAAVGVLVNGASAMMFHRSQKTDANARGAFLHLVSDALVSLAVVVAGLVMWRTRWWWLDPAMSLAVSLVIVGGAWSLFREALDLSLDAVPRHIKIAAVEEYLRGLPGVRGVHDLHVWSLSTTDVAMTAHLVMPAGAATRAMQCGVVEAMRTRFGIGHTTLQVEDLSADGESDPACQHTYGCRPSSA
ncbi:MAG: cation diffusion facilitator family transporter [Myxococcales bacterium]|nr:cation diffusion facilitator family transporter [Myxococcales bacterium]